MIELLELKDIKWIMADLDKINDRTKKQTLDIQEIKKALKELKGGIK